MFSPDSTEQSTIALLLQRLDSLLGQRDAILLELVKTSIEVHERKVQTQALGQSLEDPPSSRNDLTANAVTREETCEVR
jgi:predicted transcriptional regulator of viral defense system